MKTLKLDLTSLACVFGLLATAAAQPAATPRATVSAPATTNSTALRPDQPPPATEARVAQAEAAPAQTQTAADQATTSTNNAMAEAVTSTNTPLADGAKGLRPNLIEAPLRSVVEYLAKAAGFIVQPEVPLTGTVTVQSDQPLTKDEAIDLFNSALKKNGYALVRGDGRVLRIVRSYEGGERIDTITPNQYTNFASTPDIVTAIVPVKNVDATSLISTLMRYTVPGGSLDIDASVGANAIVVRDSKAHIHRMLELIKALDNPLYSESKVRPFPLLYADAKTLAQMIKDLFPTQNNRGLGANVAGFGGGRGGRGGGGPGGGANPFLALLAGAGGQQQTSSRMTAPSVVATADDRSNTLIVMGSDDQLAIVAEVVANVDVDVEDKLEVRSFHLKNTDPQTVVSWLQTLYPAPTTSQQNQGRGGFGARGGGFGGGRGGGGGAATGSSDRVRQETTVLAVADANKGDVVVKASHSIMVEIEDWLYQIDADTSGQIVVKSWTLDNTDPTLVLQQLQSMFPAAYAGSSAYLNQRQMGSQLSQRQQTQMSNLGRNTSTFGTSGSSMGGTSLPSDRNIKTNFTAVDSQAVLAKVTALPITAWSYKADADTRHIGPMAQDFHSAFSLGSDDKSIAVVDEGGVALAAIQGLNQKLDARDAQIQALQKEVAELKALVQSLAAKPAGNTTASQGN